MRGERKRAKTPTAQRIFFFFRYFVLKVVGLCAFFVRRFTPMGQGFESAPDPLTPVSLFGLRLLIRQRCLLSAYCRS
jgi:hypothetical protein